MPVIRTHGKDILTVFREGKISTTRCELSDVSRKTFESSLYKYFSCSTIFNIITIVYKFLIIYNNSNVMIIINIESKISE